MFMKRSRSTLTVLTAILLLVFLSACGSSHSAAPSPSSPTQQSPTGFLYVTGQSQILSFAINSDGSLTSLSPTPGPANTNVITKTMAADSSGQFLFVDDVTNNAVDVFSIDTSGALTAVSGSPFSGGSLPFPGVAGGVLTDSAGKFLYQASIPGFTIFTVDGQTGGLTPISGPPFPENDAPFEMVLDPSGKFMYADDANNSTNQVSGFALDSASGSLTALANSPFPSTLNADALGTHLLVAGQFLFRNSLLDNQIEEWSIDETNGNLTAVPNSPFSAGMDPVGMATDTTGKFLYIANLGDATISGYKIDATTGALTSMPGSPFSTGGLPPTALVVDSSGKFLYAGNSAPNVGLVSGFNINPSTGVLTAFSQGPFAAGATIPPFTQLITVKVP
jgi:6-phosphogluconolactonase